MDAAGLAIELFSLAIKTYEVFQKAIDFPDTSSAIVLRLDVELTRLQLWGKHSGASLGVLVLDLVPFEALIERILQRLTSLLQDTVELKERYGLAPIDDNGTGNKRPSIRSKSFNQVKGAFRAIVKTRANTADAGQSNDQQPQVSALDRVRWAISSETKFEQLVDDIRGYTNNLNELLRESQRTTLSHDWYRTEMQVVGAMDDASSLQLVQKMAQMDSSCQDMYTMALRKAIVLNDPNGSGRKGSVQILSKQDFDLPSDFRQLSRCIAMHHPRSSAALPITQTSYILVEKKRYEAHISSEDKAALLSRLHRLITLLNTTTPSERGALPPCLGYWSEPDDNCWCLAYRCQFLPNSTLPPQKAEGRLTSAQPLSLLYLLQSSSFRPALELRVRLAATLSTVLSRLYGGQWLHKGIRSHNIVFPYSPLDAYDISNPMIAGFEYSRQYSEPASIDFIPQDFSQALYRHPDYQSDAASRNGYRMSYDVYSFGLLLAEIAWWVPMEKMYQDVMKKKSNLVSSFHSQQAEDFLKELIRRVGKEMAFRVGTPYQKVVEWCLKQGKSNAADKQLVVEFYTNVVVPLEEVSKTF
ncbi:hypothetical protein WG66_016936 [Moniliophthora roreri]|uniref:Protein kinase domain-containing protein n=1 Tax=Moniliophthora roreri TaxID=221103 RepID=A0A0W0EXM7_MONRR|nr:hypothetical protein WG66_016936 [Moniliophthora roreri]